jgi:hypothetical protein
MSSVSCSFFSLTVAAYLQGKTLDLSEQQVHLELNAEEANRVASGGTILHGTSADKFMILGLEIEDSQ